jgi:hypothetical protein
MKTFYVWATIFSPTGVRLLTAGLVERGFKVGPLAENRRLFWEGEASTLTAFQVETGQEDVTRATLLQSVKDVLGAIGAMYHSLIVYETKGSFTWAESNIKLPPPEEKKEEPPKEEPRTRFDRLLDD